MRFFPGAGITYCLVLLWLFLMKGYAQEIQVLSATDSVRIPFASLLISGEWINYSQTANENGQLRLNRDFDDSASYELFIYCFGYDKLHRLFTGKQLKHLKQLFLVPSKISLDEVVITAQYEPLPAEKSVQRVKVIDQEKIQQMAAVNLRDVLSNQLNVRLSQDNILGAGMSLQGISGENVKILVDGVPVIGRLNGNIDLSQINLSTIERIELVEGPLSVQYGTNALAGTINLITKKAGAKKANISLSSYYESIGTYNLNLEASLRFKKHRLQANLGRNYFDGWNDERPFYVPKVRLADSSRYLAWKPKEQYLANLAYQFQMKKTELGITAGIFQERIVNRGMPRAPFGETAFDDYYDTRRMDNSIFFKRRFSRYWSVNALAAHNYFQRIKKTFYKDLTTLEERLSANSGDQDTSAFRQWMSRASFVRHLQGAKLNYELGYDLNYESASGKRIDQQQSAMGDYAVFATAEYQATKKLVLKPGLRYAYNTAYRTPVVPTLHLKWTWSERHSIRASYARGFRAPSIKELYFVFVDINHNIIGNRNLRAEQSDNYTLAYLYNRDIRKCRFKLETTVFYNTIFQVISLAQVGSSQNEYSYVNIGRYKTWGLQLNKGYHFKRLSLQSGFSYSGRSTVFSGTNDKPLVAYSPEVQFNLSYKCSNPFKTTFSVFYKYNGALPGYALVDETLVQTMVEDYHSLDLSLTHFLFREHVGFTLGCKNLLDVKTIRSTAASGAAHSSTSTQMPVATGRLYFIKLILK